MTGTWCNFGVSYSSSQVMCEVNYIGKTRRFERIHDVVEPVEEYRAGGYHPVHLEDTFQQRYRIVGKWAFGQFSTVWLAEDTRLQIYVTLKILKADVSSNSREHSILLHLARADVSHPGKNYVLQLLDQFEHHGPNGVHLCLVFPVMMSDGEAMTVRETPRYAVYVREISKQILLGLNYIHDQGLIHGDLQPANILFTVDCDLSSELMTEPEFSPVNWLPGVEVDNSAPRYLLCSQRPRGMLDNAAFSTLIVKIGDMGGAMWNTQDGSSPVTPIALRAPELLQPCSWNQKIDIWALGCLPLFPVESFGCTVDEVHGILRSLIHELFEHGNQKFAVYISERLPADFGKENSEKFANFLWSMLQERPEDRESAAELLSHSFLVG
ncbi:serine protein kinase [Aspergillus steynii IBT 23096]|uniref:non-specific serine/threonine protein kinase n=1 Tax=Aspergillus steynii IBT 23096 TaxID=1392250 RepID=A0A2I2GE97_9EURO|nr:serine protein kinase [Aspergillus steynii IBT 23096]PLB51214.1 serine protein kinase [Aspergillus steynii IBT 23096]